MALSAVFFLAPMTDSSLANCYFRFFHLFSDLSQSHIIAEIHTPDTATHLITTILSRNNFLQSRKLTNSGTAMQQLKFKGENID